MPEIIYTTTDPQRVSTFENIMRWEAGEMPPIEELDFFRDLRDTGLLFNLQGAYGRRAQMLGII